MRTYSLDLREKVVATVDEGKLPLRAIAGIFKVSFTWVKKILRQRRKRGDIAPLPHGGGYRPLLDGEKLDRLREVVAETPDATLAELCRKVKPSDRRPVSPATMCRTLKRIGLTRKKKVLVAAERNETKRGWHWELMEEFRGALPRLVFVDETGCNIDMIRRYGRSPKGERVYGIAPRNTPENMSVICALAPEGIIASLEVSGAADGPVFTAYVEHCLVPHLCKDDLVIMDNVATHCSERVSALIEAAGAHMILLPPYSPDFNPIEQCFSKMKEILRSIAARTRRKLRNALKKAINAITPEDVKGWYEHAGYWVSPECKPL